IYNLKESVKIFEVYQIGPQESYNYNLADQNLPIEYVLVGIFSLPQKLHEIWVQWLRAFGELKDSENIQIFIVTSPL
ncbi:17130_t:CDS:2, partial [Gigaspora rosea]